MGETSRKKNIRLNENQVKAVESIEGPVMVLAGPGSGKTEVLAQRVIYILNETDALPHNILCMTYTDAGVLSMRNRLQKYLGAMAMDVNISTIHAFCYNLLQEHREQNNLSEAPIIEDFEKTEILEQLLLELPQGSSLRVQNSLNSNIKTLTDCFNVFTNLNITKEQLHRKIDEKLEDFKNDENNYYKKKSNGFEVGDLKINDFKKLEKNFTKLKEAYLVYEQYQEKKAQKGLYDYDDLQKEALRLLREQEDIRLNYQEQYLYIMVDEYQDSSEIQNDIIQTLADYWESPNLFVVGDDDQSIYKFQGANVENMKNFILKYEKHLKIINLNQNYRSTPTIVNAAQEFIQKSPTRLTNVIPHLEKSLVAANSEIIKKDKKIRLVNCSNHLSEAEFVAEEIEKLINQGEKPEEIAVLYSKHKMVNTLTKVLAQKGINYHLKAEQNLLETIIIQDVNNVLYFIHEEDGQYFKNDHLLARILMQPQFSLKHIQVSELIQAQQKTEPKTSLRQFVNDIEKHQEIYQFDDLFIDQLKETIARVENLFKAKNSLSLIQFIEYLLKNMLFIKRVIRSERKIEELELLNTYFEFIKNQILKKQILKKPKFSLKDCIDLIELHQQKNIVIKNIRYSGTNNGVFLSTLHSSKGLEFNNVFMIYNSYKSDRSNSYFNLDKLYGNVKEKDTKDDSEKRRLFYVGITRAKYNLILSRPLTDANGKLLEDSKYMAELREKTQWVENETYEQTSEIVLINNISPLLIKRQELKDNVFIQQKLQNYVMSVSHLENYIKCPRQFLYNNLLRIPSSENRFSVYGTVAHAVLRNYYNFINENKKTASKKQVEEWYFKTFEPKQHVLNATEEKFFRTEGLQELMNYTTYIEKDVNLEKETINEWDSGIVLLDGIQLTGRIDQLIPDIKNPKEMVVIDYKTGKYQKGDIEGKSFTSLENIFKEKSKKDKFFRQILFYQLLLEKHRNNYIMIGGVIKYIKLDKDKDKFMTGKVYPSPENLELMKELIKFVHEKIMNLEFDQGCEEENCEWCALHRNEPIKMQSY